MIGSTTLNGVNSSTFDFDYKEALEISMKESLSEDTEGGVTVTIVAIENLATDSDSAIHRGLASGGELTIFYDISVILEQYGVDAESIFDVVDDLLITAQESSALTNRMNDLLVVSKGAKAKTVSVSGIINDADSVVVTVLQTPFPSKQPTQPPNDSSRSNTYNGGLILIFVVVVAVVVLLLFLIVFYFFFVHGKKNEISPPNETETTHHRDYVNGEPGASVCMSNDETVAVAVSIKKIELGMINTEHHQEKFEQKEL